MNAANKKWLKDAAERILWTAAQVITGAIIIEVSNVDATWAILIIPGLTVLKTALAKKVGDPTSAAIVPSE